MPCWQTNLLSLDIAAADHDLLLAALTSLNFPFVELTGGGILVTTPDGVLTIQGDKATLAPAVQPRLNEIKRAYSREVMSKVAKKYGLTATEREEDHFVLRAYQ